MDGEVVGDIDAASYVIVAKGGVVRGDIHAQEIYVVGWVEGDLWAIEVDISATGRCDGDIEAMKVNRE